MDSELVPGFRLGKGGRLTHFREIEDISLM
jgi:hypothetical protein